ncbi:DUF1848 domain-containing protein [uncultured Sphaerochaeta sp.]|uniref:DUF1848 domain-containing protein n=1 Tax=uncultured Sphaerochaeta sp. TaxID=886478 RepID=UPI002A0A5910|nr:DUF1848 domain-containing protein [uncultured Sphaerochaeta sp.]
MIISASRRTDIPGFYSDWFYRRIEEGMVYTRNPRNPKQVKIITLSPDTVDGFVFWSKNPLPMLPRLIELASYPYYFQYSLTPYEEDVQPKVPPVFNIGIETFKRFSALLGPDRIIWRYDPVLLSKKYDHSFHIKNFSRMASLLEGYTNHCTFSFLDDYRTIIKNTAKLGLQVIQKEDMYLLGKEFSFIAKTYSMALDTCAETIDLQEFGISHARCIDDRILAKIKGKNLNLKKDPNQRSVCGCVQSVDIGTYNTCMHGCLYCYANTKPHIATKVSNPNSFFL